MEFIESPIFTRLVYNYISDNEYGALRHYLVSHPEAGDLIPSSGGLRKLRVEMKKRGKSGGARIIYY